MQLGKVWFQVPLWRRIFGALILGAVCGVIFGPASGAISWIGDLFIRLIRMLIIPLVFTTLITGVLGLGDVRRLGTIGVSTIVMYLLTTLLAIVLGIGMSGIFKPGENADLSDATPTILEEAGTVSERLISIVPDNPVAAMANGDILAVIFFALLLGAALLMSGERGKPAADFMQSIADAVMNITHAILELAPFGVFALIAGVVGERGIGSLGSIAVLAIAVHVGCFLQMYVVQSGFVRIFGNLSYVQFVHSIVDAQIIAYSTGLSSATLPVSMTIARENLGIKSSVAGSVLPMGVTLNMDGTALYVGIVTVFGAQAFGIDLSMADYLLIALTTTLVSIGTASVPSASLFLIATVFSAIGISAEQTALVVGFILPFDRFLDMMRTTVNVTGDLAVATVVAKRASEIDMDIYDTKPVR